MGKPDGQPLKDATIKQSIGSLINGLSSKPSNGNASCHLDLNHVQTKLEVHDKKGSAKKGKLKKIETVSASALKTNRHVKFEPTLRRECLSHEPGSRPSPRCSNKKNKACKQEGSSSRSQQEAATNQGCGVASGSGHRSGLILMSCLNCYMHVMVYDSNPKCPKCHKGDGLLDMYRA
ncbi:hypothetical protein L1987_78968 [Smallanthus sonchifolius]|uniref:Uncharacterized protein n=1 Tax=Smallanthus sonchifolius TaxID=185202 RepID=A0ACB8ZD82_9ASTR|nr:hypothetical protein L1987_78968 [Smallanthus sonchifolius]